MVRPTKVADMGSKSESLESVLRVGKLRVRPYKSGQIKHAHVVLKQVDEEVYEDDKGRKRTRGVFSLFAQKVINVKPGKEIFLSISGHLEERVVTFEGDLQQQDEQEVDIVDSTKSEETAVQRDTQTLPPKLRKSWARKSLLPKRGIPILSEPLKSSAGVQAVPLAESVEVQATPTPLSILKQSTSTRSSVGIQSRLPSVSPEFKDQNAISISNSSMALSSALRIERQPSKLDDDSTLTISKLSTTLHSLPPRPHSNPDVNSHQRSLSPMELDSPPSSPEYSPKLLVFDLPSDEVSTDSQSRVELKEPAEQSEAMSVINIVDSTPFRVKDEPEEISLSSIPPPAKSKAARSHRAPVFVPAKYNPLSQRDASPESTNVPSQASSKVTLDNPQLPPRSPTPTNHRIPLPMPHHFPMYPPRPPISSNHVPACTPHPIPTGPTAFSDSVPYAAHIAPATFSTSMSQPTPTVPAAFRHGTSYLAPRFVPATQLSQSPQPHAPVEVPLPSPKPSTPVLLLPRPKENVQYVPVIHQSQPQWHAPASRNKNLKKRKRARAAAASKPHVEAGSQTGATESPNKKWKPIVKPEPQSPILSTLLTPTPDRASIYDGTPELPHPVHYALPTPPPSAYSSFVAKQENCEPNVPIIKSEHFNKLSFSHPHSPSAQYDPTRSYIDLTRAHENQDTVPLSSTASRNPQSMRRQTSGSCSSLPTIRTAQVKMDSSGRDGGVRGIVFDSTGELFAVICRDNTVRVWDNVSCSEIAKLAHSATVISAVWLDGGISLASMGANGVLSKWSMVGKNKWMWTKLVDSGENDPSGMAYYQHLLAVANPRKGIKIWECKNGTWLALERDIPRLDILSIKFVNNGNGLLCGSSDGTVFLCSVPKCRVQPLTTLKTKVFFVNADPSNTHALVAQACGQAHIIELTSSTFGRDIGRVAQDFSLRKAEQAYGSRGAHAFGPLFTDYGDAVVFGTIDGRVLVWDRRRGLIIHEMDHGAGAMVQAVASFDGKGGEQHLISSTRQGLLTWWRLPIRIF